MATFISSKVIKHNNTLFLDENGVIGKTMAIPTPGSGGAPAGDFWAVPITDFGVFTGFSFEPCTPDDATPPTVDSFHVFRLINENGKGRDTWIVRGRTTIDANPEYGYIQAAGDAECCEVSPRQLYTVIPAIAPCQLMCQFDANSKYFAIWGLPSLSGNLRYFAYGSFNNVNLSALTATGYASSGALVTALNSGWGSTVGGTFAYANGNLTLTQTAGDGNDVICVNVTTVNPSA